MPPPVGRYAPSGLAGPFPHLPQSHLQQQHSQQHHATHAQTPNTGLPPPSLGGHPGFGPTSASSNISPFAIPGANGMGVVGFPAGPSTAGIPDGGGTGLASHAAQIGFVRGAQMQQQQQQQQQAHLGHDNRLSVDGKGAAANSRIRDVWKHNLAQEMQVLRILVDKYPYISMDGEVPPALPLDVNTQYGANLGPAPCTWQFNFRFSLEGDMYAQESTSMLAKAGIDFAMHEKNGIDPHDFGALLMTSGLVLMDDVHWISFHSGYDFGYLMKIMLCKPLPTDEQEFHKLLTIFFPSVYDIKYLMKHAGRSQTVNKSPLTQSAAQIIANLGQKSGLQDIADELGVKRVGIAHQAGSDSLVTGEIFWKMRQLVFNGSIDESKYSGQIWGLNGQVASRPFQGTNQAQQTPNLNGATIYSNAAQTQHAGVGPLTPGGGGGVFGTFQFAKS
ncbi:CCR4-NOT transcription complex subunit 7 [Histoplasma mississippiense (nom. inval.)]|uniref:CCR4-NOT transcription complex subunit 7 n=1 Tax=Ajellomyces capsulatus (strain NAm1 / WU24) TaxID=2059318 RepID=UPI000157BD58|nr:CCR4-NOT transcription complex subunit 7 [Histoplasma mississippiense (nom. inval.)]EDN06277.1 CCR4-NOT transcription complex subunit 7 [Histoplasma mississippiense (nom. inval.)]